MMTAPSPESDVNSNATTAHSTSASAERPLAAVFRREIDDRARDAGIQRHAPEQRAENDRDVDGASDAAPVDDDAADLRSGDARGQRHDHRHQRNRQDRRHPRAVHQRGEDARKTTRTSDGAHGAQHVCRSSRAVAAYCVAQRNRRTSRDRPRPHADRSAARPDGSAPGCCAR